MAVALSYRRSFRQPKDLPHRCDVCKKPGSEDLRAEWGCDGPTSFPQLWIPCQWCKEGKDCEVCEGSEWEPVYECPRKLVWPETWELLALHAQWPGVLPYGGGLYDQPAGYIAAMRILDAAEKKMREGIQAEAEAEARFQRGARG